MEEGGPLLADGVGVSPASQCGLGDSEWDRQHATCLRSASKSMQSLKNMKEDSQAVQTSAVHRHHVFDVES